MSKETLEDWICEIKKQDNEVKLIHNCGIYNDLIFYLDLDICKSSKFRNFLVDSCDFQVDGERIQMPDYYNTTFVNTYLFSSKVESKHGDYNRLNVRFPNKGIIFSPNTLPVEGKEIGYKYSGLLQLGLFGDYFDAADKVVNIVEEFILPNEVPIYVSTSNCRDEKYKRFSAFIND